MMTEELIRLTDYSFALIESRDYDRLAEHEWHRATGGYARNHDGVFMHRMVMNAKSGQIVDHINGVRLDNRRSNLRFATAHQSAWNRDGLAGKASKYKGVGRSGKPNRPWRADIVVNGQKHFLGSYKTEQEAAFIYSQVASALCGEYARQFGLQPPCEIDFSQERTERKIRELLRPARITLPESP